VSELALPLSRRFLSFFISLPGDYLSAGALSVGKFLASLKGGWWRGRGGAGGGGGGIDIVRYERSRL